MFHSWGSFLTPTYRAIDKPINDLQAAITHSAALQYLQYRQQTFEKLTQSGINTLDVSPDQLTVELINAYLGIKRSGML